jgi:hypothetical protein
MQRRCARFGERSPQLHELRDNPRRGPARPMLATAADDGGAMRRAPACLAHERLRRVCVPCAPFARRPIDSVRCAGVCQRPHIKERNPARTPIVGRSSVSHRVRWGAGRQGMTSTVVQLRGRAPVVARGVRYGDIARAALSRSGCPAKERSGRPTRRSNPWAVSTRLQPRGEQGRAIRDSHGLLRPCSVFARVSRIALPTGDECLRTAWVSRVAARIARASANVRVMGAVDFPR